MRPGGMGSADDPDTTPAEFAGSMAERMEEAFNELLKDDGLPTFPTADNSAETRDRRRLFVAIARGVVRHLQESADSITIEVPDGNGGTETVHATIAVEGEPWP